jgi:hypothetical protein
MTDSTGTLSETYSSSSSNEATETQLAEADKLQVTEPAIGTTTQVIAAGEGMQLNFDPADVAKVEVKDGNLEITFKNGAVAVIHGYEAWVAAGGHPTGPQGGPVDVAQLGQPAAAACELPDKTVHVVDVPVPAEGERLTLAVQPGDALRLACSFRDVHGAEVGHNLEMTFPGGGVVVVEDFAAWIAAKGATISDCVCGGVNPADFIVALGLSLEDLLPAAGGAQGAENHPTFAPGQGPEILHSFPNPDILSPTALGYETPSPELTFEPVSTNNTPVVNPASNTANEAALDLNKDGNDLSGGTVIGSNPSSTGETVQGSLSFSDPDGASITKVTFNGTDFTDAGDGKADGLINVNTPLGLLAVNSTSGAYTYTLETNSLSHTTQGTGIDGVHESFTHTVSDKLGNTSSSSLVISVQDDVPHANADSKSTADIVNQTVNLVIIFDRSGSMADDPNVAGYSSRLELAKAAVAALFEAYDSVTSQLHIKIVDFSITADHSVWLSSPEEANAYLAALNADGTTNYAGANGAIPELLNNFNTVGDPVPDADRTEVYFISDGKPNPGTTTLSGSASVVTAGQWGTFLTNSSIDNAYAVGVGNGLDLNDVDLGRVSFPHGNGGAEPNRIIVLDAGQLLATLVGAIPNPLFGNILTDAPADVFGADGKGNGGVGLVSIAVDGHTYTYNQASNEIRSEANVLVTAGAVLNLDTTLDGHIEFHFDTGAYEYTPPNVSSPQVENILYTIADGDGDTSSALLTINISDAGGDVVATLTHIGTNGNDSINESGAAADIFASGGVGNDSLVGGIHNDHIQGGADNDLLVGGAGNDILIGGDGNDTLDAGTGKDFLFGGSGNDLIILGDNANFGHVDGGLAPSADLAGMNRADVLAFNGTLDLTALANDRIVGIETISMKDSEGGAGNDKLTLNASDVLNVGTGHFDPTGSFNPSGPTDFGTLVDKDTVKVDGDSGDTLNLSGGGWFNAGAASAYSGPAGYNLYVHDSGGGTEDIYALVQTVITVTGAS